jgi:hypothetical protein
MRKLKNLLSENFQEYCLVLVAHACNPSYSGSKDQWDCSSKPVWANSSCNPILKNLITKKLGWWIESR